MIACLLLLLSLCSCGQDFLTFDPSVVTQTYPYIHRIDPATGKVGDTITIYGFGYSIAPGLNVISLGGSSIVATGYTPLANPVDGEFESLTTTVPAEASAGDTFVFVTVFGNTSNANIAFTVTE